MPKAVANENPLPPPCALLSQNLFSVRNLNVLITGGGSGIGAMIAGAFVENGATVMICSRKDTSSYAAELTERAKQVPSPGRCLSLAGVDVGKEADLEKLFKWVEEVVGKDGSLDVLVNNSGTNYAGPLMEYKGDMFRKVLDVNVTAQFIVAQKLLPLMQRVGSKAGVKPASEVMKSGLPSPAKIINITSINGERPPGLETYAYSTSKAALRHLTQHLASRLAAVDSGKNEDGKAPQFRGVNVNAIAPGSFMSRMMRGTIKMAGEDLIADQNAIPRLGMPQDIGSAALWLGSGAGDWVTGAVVVVDGGALVRSALSRM